MIKLNPINSPSPDDVTRGGSAEDAEGNSYLTIFISTKQLDYDNYVACSGGAAKPRVFEVFTENLHSDKAFTSSGTVNIPDSCYSDWWARTGAGGVMNDCSTNDDVDDTAPGIQSLRNSIGHHYKAGCDWGSGYQSGWWDAPDHHMCPDGFTAGDNCQWAGISTPKYNFSMSFENDDLGETNSSNGNGRAMTGQDYNCVGSWGVSGNSYGKMCDDGGFPALDNEDGNAAWSSGCFNLYPNGYYQNESYGANGYPNGDCDADGGMCVWPAAMWDAILWKKGNPQIGTFSNTASTRGHWGVSRVDGDHYRFYDQGGYQLSFGQGKSIAAAGIRCIKEWGVGCPTGSTNDAGQTACNDGEYPPGLPEWPHEITWSSGWTSCNYTSCAGCTDPSACNFDASATQDDGSCDMSSCYTYGCTDPNACNFDPDAGIADGSCNSPDYCDLCDGENTGPTPPGGYSCVYGGLSVCHPKTCLASDGPPWIKTPYINANNLLGGHYRNTYRFHELWATEDLIMELDQNHWIGVFHPTKTITYHDPYNQFSDVTENVMLGDQRIYRAQFADITDFPGQATPIDVRTYYDNASNDLPLIPEFRAWRDDPGDSAEWGWAIGAQGDCNYIPQMGIAGNPQDSVFRNFNTEDPGLIVDRSACAQSDCRPNVAILEGGDWDAIWQSRDLVDDRANLSSFPNCGLETARGSRSDRSNIGCWCCHPTCFEDPVFDMTYLADAYDELMGGSSCEYNDSCPMPDDPNRGCSSLYCSVVFMNVAGGNVYPGNCAPWYYFEDPQIDPPDNCDQFSWGGDNDTDWYSGPSKDDDDDDDGRTRPPGKPDPISTEQDLH